MDVKAKKNASEPIERKLVWEENFDGKNWMNLFGISN